jgi:hypothetical protein
MFEIFIKHSKKSFAERVHNMDKIIQPNPQDEVFFFTTCITGTP